MSLIHTDTERRDLYRLLTGEGEPTNIDLEDFNEIIRNHDSPLADYIRNCLINANVIQTDSIQKKWEDFAIALDNTLNTECYNKEKDECCVCLKNHNFRTQCGHSVCTTCINRINKIENVNTCPMCRQRMFRITGYDEEDDGIYFDDLKIYQGKKGKKYRVKQRHLSFS